MNGKRGTGQGKQTTGHASGREMTAGTRDEMSLGTLFFFLFRVFTLLYTRFKGPNDGCPVCFYFILFILLY